MSNFKHPDSIVPRATGRDLRSYFMGHVRPFKDHEFTYSDFYEVTKPLYVFKKILVPRRLLPSGVSREVSRYEEAKQAVANLIIPVGAKVFAEHGAFANDKIVYVDSRKMRASEAFVHSIVRVSDGVEIPRGTSLWNGNFRYVKGKTVRPQYRFSTYPAQCESGIHFFLQGGDAVGYTH